MDDCVPADGFWTANRGIADLVWQQHDGATISTRLAELLHETTGASIAGSKTALHAVAAASLGAAAGIALRSPIAGVLLGLLALGYLERDRC